MLLITVLAVQAIIFALLVIRGIILPIIFALQVVKSQIAKNVIFLMSAKLVIAISFWFQILLVIQFNVKSLTVLHAMPIMSVKLVQLVTYFKIIFVKAIAVV